MKSRIALIVSLLSICAGSVQAQENCCTIVPGSVQTSAATTTVPPSGTNPGGTYTSSETQTYTITCTNSQTQMPCSKANVPNNVVTATGTGAYSGAAKEFVACNPIFPPR